MKTEENKPRGPRSGRRAMPKSDRKVQVAVYIKASDVVAVGGMDRARILVISYLETAAALAGQPDFPYNLGRTKADADV